MDRRDAPPSAPASAAAVSSRAVRGGGERRGEGFPRHERLRRRADFLRAYREGRRRGGRWATLFFVANSLPHPRLGITVSRKVAKRAVVRQRLKRRVREIYRRWDRRSQLPPLDLVVNLKPPATAAEFSEIRRELERQLGSLLPAAGPEAPRSEASVSR